GLYSTDHLIYAVDNALVAKIQPALQQREKEAEAKKDARLLDECRRMIQECDKALRSGRRHYRPVVTFRMLRQAGGRPLAMVATNLKTGSVHLFSSDATPDVQIALAVAASSAVPFLFQPVNIDIPLDGEHLFVDGGVTSNLPAWPYDVQREINRDLYTMAIEISADASNREFRWWRLSTWGIFRPFHNLGGLMNATIFGARRLELRRTRAINVPMDTSIELLQFNMSRARALMEVHWARAAFRGIMNLRISRRSHYAKTCLLICQAVREHLKVPVIEFC